jgi:predicted site-specific integrase-resolvase
VNRDELLSTFEAAQILDCAPDTVRHMARTGRLPIAVQTRAGRLYDRAEVSRLAAERRERGKRVLGEHEEDRVAS